MANELYRQSVHLALGVGLALAAALLSRTAFLWLAGLGLVCGVGFVWLSKSNRFLYTLLEREDAAFSGKGVFFFCLGVLLSAALFYEQTSLAILLLAIPDAAATLVGTAVRSPPLPYNHRKSAAGSGAFFISSAIVLSFAGIGLAVLFIAFLLTALESFDYREIPFLDDNLVIPVIAAYLLALAIH